MIELIATTSWPSKDQPISAFQAYFPTNRWSPYVSTVTTV